MARSLLLSILLLPFFSAHAADVTLAGTKAWGFVEETEPTVQATVCKAFTQTSDGTEPVELSVSYPKDGSKAPLILIKTMRAAPWAAMKLSTKGDAVLFQMHASTAAGDPNVYWYAPLDFKRAESTIASANDLKVVFGPQAAPVTVKVSLSGSSKALSAAKDCAKAAPSSKEFLAALTEEKSALTPDLGDHSPALLFKAVDEAFAAYRRTGEIADALETLRKPFQPVLKKEASARKAAVSAQEKSDDAKAALEAGQALVVQQEAQLAQDKATLASLQTEKPLAEQNLAAKKAVYDPLKAQMKAYEKKIEDAERTVRHIEADIRSNENLIPRNRGRIRDLENERSRVKNSIPGLESEERSLRSAFDDADRDYRSYDVGRERDRILDSDWSYRNAKSDLESKKRDLDRAQWDARSARQDANRLEGDLRNCQQDPTKDCSGIQSQLNQARNEENRAESQVRSLEWDISSAESRIRSAEDDAQRKASSESDRLRRVRDEYESQWRQKSSEIDWAHQRINEINNEIPDLKREIARAEKELPELRNQLAAAQTALAQVKAERDQVAQQIGFDKAEQEFVAATEHLKTVKDGIADKTKSIPRLERTLASSKKAVPSLQKSYDRAQIALTAAQTELAGIEAQLKSLREQEAPLLAEQTKENERFQLNQAIFQNLYVELAGKLAAEPQ